MDKIRVLQIVSGIAIGDQSGGAESFALRLAYHLDRSIFIPAIFSIRKYGSSAEIEWEQRLKYKSIELAYSTNVPSTQTSTFTENFYGVYRFFNEYKPDIISSHSDRSDLLSAIIKITHSCKPIITRTIHIDQFWLSRPWANLWINHFLFPLVFDRDIAISESIQKIVENRLLSRILRRKSTLCYNGIDSALFSIKSPTQNIPIDILKIVQQSPTVGIIGRLTEQKAHIDLLKAIQIVNKSIKVRLLIIGSGPLEKPLQEFAQACGIGDYVHFLGSRQDVLNILPALTLLVSSSSYEGFPTVLLEAMALGVPVVATDVSGSRELVITDQTGILVPVHNSERIADAIIFMLTNPIKAKEMALRAKELASQYTIQRVVEIYSTLYLELFNKRASR